MARVLLDACVPQWLRAELSAVEVATARYARLDELSDRELLAAVEGRFDVLVTLDRNLTYQQKMAGRSFGLIVLRVSDQAPEAFRALVPRLAKVLREVNPARCGKCRRQGEAR